MCRRRPSWQGAPVHPSSALPCSPHIVLPGRQVGGGAPLPRTFRRSRWGQNSKLRWHRAAPVHHCSRWLSKAKKGLGGGSSGGWRPEHQLQPPHHITQMCLCHRSTKNFCQAAHISPPLLRTDYCACCRFRVRQQRNLHLGSHIKLLALFLKLSLILCTKESSQIEAAHT